MWPYHERCLIPFLRIIPNYTTFIAFIATKWFSKRHISATSLLFEIHTVHLKFIKLSDSYINNAFTYKYIQQQEIYYSLHLETIPNYHGPTHQLVLEFWWMHTYTHKHPLWSHDCTLHAWQLVHFMASSSILWSHYYNLWDFFACFQQSTRTEIDWFA